MIESAVQLAQRLLVGGLFLLLIPEPALLQSQPREVRHPGFAGNEAQAAQMGPVMDGRRGGLDADRLHRVDELIAEAIGEQQLRGAVVLVGHGDRVAYQKEFGSRALVPSVEPMTADTIFDLASLTKVVATTTSMMILVEEGRIRLNERVSHYIPEFGRYGKQGVTIRHLLAHVSGLRPDIDLNDLWVGYDTAISRAADEILVAAPGQRFIYSDINYFLLGEIVSRVSGMPLDQFARARIFEPLGMHETMFNPPPALLPRIAPTEPCTPYGWPCEGDDAVMLRGVVHDPTARRMGGVAGHAGLFSTAPDLALFCRMILGGGALPDRPQARILSPLTVARMMSPATPPQERNVRGLGWDLDSRFSANRGELLPAGSVGHTGWTGTSIWVDPATETFVIFLSSRLHPDGGGDVTPLRARVATAVGAALVDLPAAVWREARSAVTDFGAAGPPPARRPADPVLTGLDVLRAEGFARLRGRRVGLVTNHTGLARDGATAIDLLHQARDVQLVALFSPEHGIRGVLDEKVPSSVDERTGLPIHSLYGETRRPTSAMLEGLDTVVIDLQDIGARFYTYMTTMAYVMEEAAPRGLQVVVLDRPNPINGFRIEGPGLDEASRGFTGYFPMPIRHGLTLGELARLFNEENRIGADLVVLEMKGWTRDDWFDRTGLRWINPSPNMRNLNQATLYPGIGAIEQTNLSVGRGTDAPFEQIGAPWVDGVRLAEELNGRELAGIRFYPVRFTPASSKFAGEVCEGVYMIVTDRLAVEPVRVGLEIASALHRLHGHTFQLEDAARLFGSRETLQAIRAGEEPSRIAARWGPEEARWRLLRSRYLIYR
jgi:uncharacterized protein YbbC (DUF1343 family)/CubicO group peptidase (beta-lactamase class C family)